MISNRNSIPFGGHAFHRVFAGVLFLFAAALAAPYASAQETADIAIEAQPLDNALVELSTQTGVGIFARGELVQGLDAPPLSGTMTMEDALRQLLKDTGLTYQRNEDGSYVVLSPNASVAGQNTVGQRRPGIEEIIVTGQKREERIQDVPIAISAFTQEDLTTSQIAGGPDLHLQVPNMTFTKTNFTGYSIQIRGIGTQAISATTDPAVAVALNQTPFIRNNFFEQEFYDLERVEVLRGPQGTLFGRNATAGVVNLVTAKPKFQHESMFSYDKGNYDSSRWEAMVNIPLVDDRMALRLAGAGTQRDGYAVNEITDSPIDGRDLWSTRASLRFAPTDNLDINLIWEHFEENDDRLRSGKQLCSKHVVKDVNGKQVATFDQRLRSNGLSGAHIAVQPRFSQGCIRESLYSNASFQTPNGASVPYYVPLSVIGLPTTRFDPYESQVQSRDLRVIESTVDPEYRARADIGQLQIDYQLTDSLTLNSDTAYSTNEVYSLQDFNRFNTVGGAWDTEDTLFGAASDDGFPSSERKLTDGGVLDENGFFCDPQIGCSDRLVAIDISSGESSQFSQELRLSSQFGGPFNFSLGANYLRYDSEDKYYVFINSLTLTLLSGGTNNYSIITPDNPYVPGSDNINDECLNKSGGKLPPPESLQSGGLSCTYIEPNSIENLDDTGHNYFLSNNPYDLDSYAIFGEAYWNITDQLKLTAGLRWSVDKKTAPRIPSRLYASHIGFSTLEVIEQEWREPTGRLVLDWKPTLDFTDETLVYGSFARGYKAGGANPPPYAGSQTTASLSRPVTFDAEFVNAFEVGTKNTLADGDVTLNLAAFYYDYKDYQISEIVDRSAFNQNYDTEAWGFEVETDWWARENLRLGFKGGYQKTRIGDHEKAIDLMDRTAGGRLVVTDARNPNYSGTLGDGRPVSEYVGGFSPPDDQEFYAYDDWIVLRPFPTFPSSCILPVDLFAAEEISGIWDVGAGGGSADGGCQRAYNDGLDPITGLPYEPDPDLVAASDGDLRKFIPIAEGGDNPNPNMNYPGFDPSMPEINGGEGFAKDLGGNELPNAPNYTATVTADYIIPLGGDWLATLHTDIYWQSKAWWRIFNDHEYNRLDDYFTMNLAAIFANERSGWTVMAYVKNVTDETAITGAFLGSDDTGLTTNVFLTEPRLYGLRVTKRWGDGGGPGQWIGGGAAALFGKEPDQPFPFSLTLGGNLLRPKEAANEIVAPTFITAFDPNADPTQGQGQELDWGDGREIVLTYAPDNGWRFSLGARFGESNRDKREIFEGETVKGCVFFAPALDCYGFSGATYRTNYGLSDLTESEEHLLVDFMVGRDVGLGFDGVDSSVSAGIRYAHFESRTDGQLQGTPDWQLGDCLGGRLVPACGKYDHPGQHHEYEAAADVDREFEGVGPVVTWDASIQLLGDARGGHLDLEWTLSAGALFGKQETAIEGVEEARYYNSPVAGTGLDPREELTSSTTTPFSIERRESATVPTLGAGVGLTYRIGGASIGAGYHWERYFDVIDGGGMEERREYDRTIDGPYLKVTFGGGS